MELTDFTARIGAALVFGALIGLERQWYHRLAGMRTHVLVSTGAAAFVSTWSPLSSSAAAAAT